MTSHRDHSFECVCKNGFFGEYCEKGLCSFLICCDSIDIDNVYFFFLFFNCAIPFYILTQNKPTPSKFRGIVQGRGPRMHVTTPTATE